MANWLLVVDPNAGQRSAYVTALRESIAPYEGLKVSSREGPRWSAIWAAGDRAPIDVDVSAGYGSFVWGEARDSSGKLQSAQAVREQWRDGAVRLWDGYYSAVTVEDGGQSLIACSDILGVYPLYYWSDGKGVVLVGTSPELFRGHPQFRATLDVQGLLGILLTNGLVNNQTIWRDVRRLGAGNRVRFDRARVFEDTAYRIPTEPTAVDLPTSGHAHMLEQAFAAAMHRHAPAGRDYNLLLSGGLDSRLLAGYLAEYEDKIECLTFGQPRDYEMLCAKAVADACGMKHHAHRVPAERYAEAVRQSARWEMLSAGFSGIYEWTIRDSLLSLPDRVIGGHLLDAVIGGSHIDWAFNSESGKLDFDGLLSSLHSWAIDSATLKSMLVPGVREIVDDVMATARKEYEEGAEQEHYRSWIFDLHHRQRFHVGAVLWPISFSSWPVIPCLDREVIATVAAFPCCSLAERRVQDEFYFSKFPNLATLPIDRNSEDCLPANPSMRDFLQRSLRYRIEKYGRLARSALGIQERERVFYRRLYDINSPEWRLVRQLREPATYDLPDIFLTDKVSQCLPDPDSDIHVSPPVIPGTSAARLLIGLSLCNSSFDTN